MPKFIVERNVPGAGKLTRDQLCDISAKSNAVVAGLGVPYVWHHTYAAGDKLYCVHEADSAETIYRHAKEGGFPADLVAEIKNTFGPETANGPALCLVWKRRDPPLPTVPGSLIPPIGLPNMGQLRSSATSALSHRR